MTQLPMLELLAIANGEVAGKKVIYPIQRDVHFAPLWQREFENARQMLSFAGVRHTVMDHGYPNGATIRMEANNKEELTVLAEVFIQKLLNDVSFNAIWADMKIRRPFKDVLLRKPRPKPNLDKADETHARIARKAVKYNLQLR